MSERKKLSAMNAAGDNAVVIPRTCFGTDEHWLLTDGYQVTLCKQRTLENPTATITMPRAEFNRLIRGYIKEQRVRR